MFDGAELAAGRIGLLRTGIRHADLITTVSPTYAREIQGPEYGMGLEGLLTERAASLVGVLNGVDYDEWDPRTDRYLPQHYDDAQLQIKATLKQQLLMRLGLARPPLAPLGPGRRGLAPEATARRPLLGVVSRAGHAEGFRSAVSSRCRGCCPSATSRWSRSARVSAATRIFFATLARSYPTRVHFIAATTMSSRTGSRPRATSPDALALRALRTQSDVQPALRQACRSCAARADWPIPSSGGLHGRHRHGLRVR